MESAGRHIPNKLKRTRRLLGYSQKQVAVILGVYNADLSEWERGVRMPQAENIFKLSVLYNQQPQMLYPALYQTAKKAVLAQKEKNSKAVGSNTNEEKNRSRK